MRLILALAEALREEFGVGVDAHPGGEGNEAGVVNRAFLAATRILLGYSKVPGIELTPTVALTLHRVTLGRLAQAGVEGEAAQALLKSGQAYGDHWFAYLILASESLIDELKAGT